MSPEEFIHMWREHKIFVDTISKTPVHEPLDFTRSMLKCCGSLSIGVEIMAVSFFSFVRPRLLLSNLFRQLLLLSLRGRCCLHILLLHQARPAAVVMKTLSRRSKLRSVLRRGLWQSHCISTVALLPVAQRLCQPCLLTELTRLITRVSYSCVLHRRIVL